MYRKSANTSTELATINQATYFIWDKICWWFGYRQADRMTRRCEYLYKKQIDKKHIVTRNKIWKDITNTINNRAGNLSGITIVPAHEIYEDILPSHINYFNKLGYRFYCNVNGDIIFYWNWNDISIIDKKEIIYDPSLDDTHHVLLQEILKLKTQLKNDKVLKEDKSL